jgi:hypothetical protein
MNGTLYQTYPIISLVNIMAASVACSVAVPCAFFPLWRTNFYARLYLLSLQIRLQIFTSTFAVTNILIMNLYLLYCVFFIENTDLLPETAGIYARIVYRIGDSAPEYDKRKIFGMFTLKMLHTFEIPDMFSYECILHVRITFVYSECLFYVTR